MVIRQSRFARVVRRIVVPLIGCLALPAAFAFAQAQPRPQQPPWPQQQQQQKPAKLEAKGTIDEVQGNIIGIKTEDNQMWLVQVNHGKVKVQVDGTAEVSFLQPGQTVKFTGEVDEKGNLTKEVDKLEIYTAVGRSVPGLYKEGADETAKPEKKPGAGTYEIRGKVQSFKDNHLVVSAGSKKIVGTVNANAEISVKLADAADLGYAQKGDTVKAMGWYYENSKPGQNKPGQAICDDISITLSQPLSSGKKAKPIKPSRVSKSKQPAGGDSVDPADPFGSVEKPKGKKKN